MAGGEGHAGSNWAQESQANTCEKSLKLCIKDSVSGFVHTTLGYHSQVYQSMKITDLDCLLKPSSD